MTELGVVLEKFWVGMALHLWQTTLILAVLLILGLGLRRAPARYTNTIGWLALLKLLVPLSLLGGLGLIPFGAPGGVAGPLVLTEYVRVVLEPSALAKPVDGGLESEVYPYIALTVAWLFGIGLLLRRQRSALPETMVRLRAVRPEIRARVEQALSGTSISPGTVRVVATAIPAVRGVLRPTIVIPEPVIEALAPEALRAVLLHEEAHRVRRDTWRAVVWRIVLAVYFFYPPAWWLIARLRVSAELACDEAVLSKGVSPRVYSGALARALASGIGVLPAPRSVEVGLGRPGSISVRLDRIENPWRYRAMTKHRVLAAVAVLVLAGSILAPATSTAPADPPTRGQHTEAAIDPLPWLADLERLALDENPIDVDFNGTSLAMVFMALEKGTQLRFEGADKLSRTVNVSYAKLTAHEILVRLATTFRLEYEVLDSRTVRVLARSPFLAGIDEVGNPTLRMESKVSPVYPEAARADKAEGSVILQAFISREGIVTEVEVLRASQPDYPGFEESAIEAVSQWRYEPALRDGEPVDVYFTIFVEFKLN